jgi:hypothetical protein
MTKGNLPGMTRDDIEAVCQHGIDEDSDENGDEVSADHKLADG